MSPVHSRQGGFVFLWLLFLVAGLGVGMAALGTLWHNAVQREKEAELLFIGDQYRRAIEHFLKAGPSGQQPRLPQSLDELLLDPRFPNTVRHLRRLYPDPITGKQEWGLLRDAQGGIGGVFSTSNRPPFKTRNFPLAYDDFTGKTDYRQWQFIATGVASSLHTDQPDAVSETAAGQTAPPLDSTNAQSSPKAMDAAQTQTRDSDNRSHANKIVACQKTMELDFRACSLNALGSGTVFEACMEEANARHKTCLAGG
jgi:type II secretory pathway pseudopilin PulG